MEYISVAVVIVKREPVPFVSMVKVYPFFRTKILKGGESVTSQDFEILRLKGNSVVGANLETLRCDGTRFH